MGKQKKENVRPSARPTVGPSDRPTVRPSVRWAVLATYMGAVAWLSLAPARTFESAARLVPIPYFDKVVHFILYGLLVALGRWAAAAQWTIRPGLRLALAGAIGYGILMEVLQGAMASYHRSFELGDIVANSLGAICFWFAAAKYSQQR